MEKTFYRSCRFLFKKKVNFTTRFLMSLRVILDDYQLLKEQTKQRNKDFKLGISWRDQQLQRILRNKIEKRKEIDRSTVGIDSKNQRGEAMILLRIRMQQISSLISSTFSIKKSRTRWVQLGIKFSKTLIWYHPIQSQC